MISKAAVRNFVNRKLKSLHKFKKLTKKEMWLRINAMKPKPHFYTEPYKHQLVCFYLGILHPRLPHLLDMGGGKSKVALDLVNYHYKAKGISRKTLVLVPYASNVGQWKTQAKLHAPNLKVVCIDEKGDEARLKQLHKKVDVVVMTYMAWLRFVCKPKKREEIVNFKKVITEKGWDLDRPKAKKLVNLFDAVIFDEMTSFRNHGTLLHRAMLMFLSLPVAYGLSGSPHGRKISVMWPQFKVIDGGKTLGDTLGLFRAAYFREVEQYWSPWPSYVLRKKRKPALQRAIRSGSIRYSDKEMNDLPPQNFSKEIIKLPDETWIHYDRITEEIRKAKGIKNKNSIRRAFIRLRQLSSGYVLIVLEKDKTGKPTKRHYIDFKENAKLEAVVDAVKDLPAGRKCIIYHEYNHTGKLLTKMLKQEKIKHMWLWSGTAKKIKQNIEADFTNSKTHNVLLMSSAGCYGLNLQCANHTFIAESPSDPIIRGQLLKRTNRTGQKRPCFYKDFVAEGTVDERVLDFCKEGKDLLEEMIDGKATL